MRQRRVRGIEERLLPYEDLILSACTGAPGDFVGREKDKSAGSPRLPAEVPAPVPAPPPADSLRHSRWYQRLSPRYRFPEGFRRVYAEIGCGRGLFINAVAAEDPEGLYIGAEGCKTIVIRALEKTRAAGIMNVRYIDAFINYAEEAFPEGSLAGLFLNFSDPWPKDRHADRRLTAPAKAEAYLRVLTPGGFVSFKTDGEEFYKYSLETFTTAGFQINVATCGVAERAEKTPTEYELKFRSLDKPIYHFTAVKP